MVSVLSARNPKRSIYSIHFAEPDGSHGALNKEDFLARNFSDEWHTVRFEYGVGGALRWYLDGRLVHALDAAPTLQGYPAPFNQRVGEIKINLALGGRPGPLSDGALANGGATFEVDYVRVVTL